MPRGYLKHSPRAVGRKKSRGGSSKSFRWYWEDRDCYGRINRLNRLAQIQEYDFLLSLRDTDCYCRISHRNQLPQFQECDVFEEYDVFYDDYDDDDKCHGEDLHPGGVDESEQVRPSFRLADFASNQFFLAIKDRNEKESTDDNFATAEDGDDEESYSLCAHRDDTGESLSAFSLVDRTASSDTHKNYMKVVSGTTALRQVKISSMCESEASYIDVDIADVDSLSCVSCDPVLDQGDRPPLHCAICLEEKPLLKLMKKCRHPLACYDCLRELYVVRPQQEVDVNLAETYPLQCFWPTCGKVLRGGPHVQQLAKTSEELTEHYRREWIAKCLRKQKVVWWNKARRKLVRYERSSACPDCSCINTFQPYRNLDEAKANVIITNKYEIKCMRCRKSYQCPYKKNFLSPKEAWSVVVAIGGSFAICPSCGTFIIKDGGCDHMACSICSTDFSYETGEAL